jgi:Bacterial SH3 domain
MNETLTRTLVVLVALGLSAGAAFASAGETKTDLALRAKPAPKAELLLDVPAGTAVTVGHCARGWCAVSWKGYAGYARQSGLLLRRTAVAVVAAAPPAVFPPYPYHAGHYPDANAYYDLPPYANISPSFYRWRYFLTFRERNRYRYVPHIFTNYDHAFTK